MSNPKQLTFPWEKNFKSSVKGFYCDPNNKKLFEELINFDGDDVFMYGTNNIGKTYLLQAICNYYNSDSRSSLYIPLMDVKNYDTAIIDNVSSLDLVCIDGLDQIANNSEWEIALFNLINSSLNTECRLIFSANFTNKTLQFGLPDFESRIKKLNSFEMTPVQDLYLKEALLHISEFRSINLGEKEIKYLLGYTKRNLSDLVSILERLDSLSMELKRKITIPLIKDYL